MTSEFMLYLRLGFEHISDLNGYDHILFVIALAAVYPLKEWRHLLILVTAFTIGHSITLAMATLGWLAVDSDLIEMLIPVTIFITAVINIAERFASDAEKALQLRLAYEICAGAGIRPDPRLGLFQLPSRVTRGQGENLVFTIVFIQCWIRNWPTCHTCHYICNIGRSDLDFRLGSEPVQSARCEYPA